MTPEPLRSLPEDIRKMLIQAKPAQLDRLLWDIVTTEPQTKEARKYDA